jgi:hypothetical protein
MRLAMLLLALAGCGLPVASAAPPGPPSRPPEAPTDLTVRIVNRRATSMEVCWTAGSGRPADTFEVRYAKVPIIPEIFDDSAVTARAPFTGPRRPYAAGERVCQLVTGLYIENGYYFAVRARVDDPPPAAAATEPTS